MKNFIHLNVPLMTRQAWTEILGIIQIKLIFDWTMIIRRYSITSTKRLKLKATEKVTRPLPPTCPPAHAHTNIIT